jgi:hypothetical protein
MCSNIPIHSYRFVFFILGVRLIATLNIGVFAALWIIAAIGPFQAALGLELGFVLLQGVCKGAAADDAVLTTIAYSAPAGPRLVVTSRGIPEKLI